MTDRSIVDRDTRIKRLFKSLDVDGKNEIDSDALTLFMIERYQDFDGLDDAVNQLLDTIASCGGATNSLSSPSASHSITYPSFKKYIDATESYLEKSFVNLDSNKDGLLEVEDLRNGLEDLGFDIDDDKIEVLFNAIDSDNDGYISLDDWRDQLTFVPKERVDEPPLQSAYMFFIEDLDLSSEGDVLLSSESSSGLGYFLAGGLAGVVSRTCTAPFDRLKVFLIAQSGTPRQAQSRMMSTSAVQNNSAKIAANVLARATMNTGTSPSGFGTATINITEAAASSLVKKPPSPLIQALKFLWSQGGIRAFFVGNGLNVVKVFPESAMKFGSFEAAKRLFAQIEGVSGPTEISRASTFVSGGLAGMAAQLTIYPIDTLKFRVQCSAQFSKLRGNQLLIETIKGMWAEGGISLFYRGIHVGVLGIFPFAALDLGIFSAMRKAYIRNQAVKNNIDISEVKIGNLVVLTMGAVSGSIGASAVYPVNLLRTRLQAQGTAAHPYRYTGFRDVLRKTIQRDGYRGLWRGLVPNLIKVAPAVSISYLVYEKAKTTMHLK